MAKLTEKITFTLDTTQFRKDMEKSARIIRRATGAHPGPAWPWLLLAVVANIIATLASLAVSSAALSVVVAAVVTGLIWGAVMYLPDDIPPP